MATAYLSACLTIGSSPSHDLAHSSPGGLAVLAPPAVSLRLVLVTIDAEERLRQGYRVIRLLATESPWPGALVCGPTGQTALAVDSALLGDDWGGWSGGSSGHILAPIDVLRRTDGHDVLLPVCTELLAEFLERRSDLALGEGVTIAVSLLRAVGEMRDPSSELGGTWWLTEAGRPVFASDTGGRSLVEETGQLLHRLGVDLPPLAGTLADAASMIAEPRHRVRDLDRAEAVLFAAADPLPLATTNFAPRRARTLAQQGADVPVAEDDGRPRSWMLSLFRHLDADWADLVSRTTTGVWRALRERRTGPRRPWLVAGGLASCVLVAGLVWPSGSEGPAVAGSTPSSAAPNPEPGISPEPPPADDAPPVAAGADSPSEGSPPTEDAGAEGEVAPPASSTDLTAIAAGLLAARADCGPDAECLAALIETPDAQFPAGVIDLPAGGRTLTLLDDFGGAAVLRADAIGSEQPPQLIVLVRADDRWLLREVYAVAEQ